MWNNPDWNAYASRRKDWTLHAMHLVIRHRLQKKTLNHLELVDFPASLVRYILPQHHLAHRHQEQSHEQPPCQGLNHRQELEALNDADILRAAPQKLHAAEVEGIVYRYAGNPVRRRSRLQGMSAPKDPCEEDDKGKAEQDSMRGANSIAAGEPGQLVDHFRNELGLTRLLFLSILEIAVVLILEPLQIPEVPCQGEIDRAAI